jgi:HAD superfamily hydrolase (TIGR01509 family)
MASDGFSVTGSALLLDLDGTLVDSVHLHTVAWCQALEQAGTTVAASVVQPLIGMGGEQLLRHVLGHDDAGLEEAHAGFFAPLRALVRPLPGAAWLLEQVRDLGVGVYVVTSSKPDDAEHLLGLFPAGTIDGVVHGDDVVATKPSPDLFQVALDRWGLDPARAVAVGDSEWDIHAGRDAGLRCVGVLTGGTPADLLFSAGAIAVFRSLLDMATPLWDPSPSE